MDRRRFSDDHYQMASAWLVAAGAALAHLTEFDAQIAKDNALAEAEPSAIVKELIRETRARTTTTIMTGISLAEAARKLAESAQPWDIRSDA